MEGSKNAVSVVERGNVITCKVSHMVLFLLPAECMAFLAWVYASARFPSEANS